MTRKRFAARFIHQSRIFVNQDFLHIRRNRLQLLLHPLKGRRQQRGFVYLALKLEHLDICPKLRAAGFVMHAL